MPNNEPVTKQDLLDLQASTKQDLLAFAERLLASQTEMELRITENLTEKMRATQTEVIRAFGNWARPVDIKLRRLSEFDERIGLLEERMGAIERGDPPIKSH